MYTWKHLLTCLIPHYKFSTSLVFRKSVLFPIPTTPLNIHEFTNALFVLRITLQGKRNTSIYLELLLQ